MYTSHFWLNFALNNMYKRMLPANSKEGDFSCDGGALQGITVFPK